MNDKVIDGMKKEGKGILELTLFTMVLLICQIIIMCRAKAFQDTDEILKLIIYALFFLSSLYWWLSVIKYRVEIDNERVYLKTLFRKIEINICDIKEYSCKRYRESIFYQFYLFTEKKRVLINTRYKDEFEKILKEHDIKQVFKKKKK